MFTNLDLSSLTTVDGILHYVLSNAIVSGIILAGLSGVGYKVLGKLWELTKKIVGVYMFPQFIGIEKAYYDTTIIKNLYIECPEGITKHHVISSESDILVPDTVYYLKVRGKWLRCKLKSRELTGGGEGASSTVYKLSIMGIGMRVSTLTKIMKILNQKWIEPGTITIDQNGTNYWSSYHVATRAMDKIALAEYHKQAIDASIVSLMDPSKVQQRKALAVPNKLVIMLSGPPGTGKSSIAMAIANEYSKFKPSTVTNYLDWNSALRGVQSGDIIVMDDIDAMSDSAAIMARRAGVDDKTKVSPALSEILKFLDFTIMQHNETKLVIMTTNHPEKLDPAFLRSGRIDLHLHIDHPSKDVLHTFYAKFREGDDPTELVEYMYTNGIHIPDMNWCVANTNSFDEAISRHNQLKH